MDIEGGQEVREICSAQDYCANCEVKRKLYAGLNKLSEQQRRIKDGERRERTDRGEQQNDFTNDLCSVF